MSSAFSILNISSIKHKQYADKLLRPLPKKKKYYREMMSRQKKNQHKKQETILVDLFSNQETIATRTKKDFFLTIALLYRHMKKCLHVHLYYCLYRTMIQMGAYDIDFVYCTTRRVRTHACIVCMYVCLFSIIMQGFLASPPTLQQKSELQGTSHFSSKDANLCF